MSDDDEKKIDLEAERRQMQRDKTTLFTNRMYAKGFKRWPVWFSPDSQARLKKLARHTSREKAIEEALILAEIVAELWPDSEFLDKPDRLKAVLKAIPRSIDELENGENSRRDEADDLIRRRVAKARGKLKAG